MGNKCKCNCHHHASFPANSGEHKQHKTHPYPPLYPPSICPPLLTTNLDTPNGRVIVRAWPENGAIEAEAYFGSEAKTHAGERMLYMRRKGGEDEAFPLRGLPSHTMEALGTTMAMVYASVVTSLCAMEAYVKVGNQVS